MCRNQLFIKMAKEEMAEVTAQQAGVWEEEGGNDEKIQALI